CIDRACAAGAPPGPTMYTYPARHPPPGLVMTGTLFVCSTGAAAVALMPTLWLAVVPAVVTGLSAGVFGTLNNALIQITADPAYLGRVTSVVMLTMVGLAPLSYPLVGAAIGTWGAAPVFTGCGAFAGLGAVIALASGAVRRAELPRRQPSAAS
ncbi:MFS transporter, partial [Streptomyces prasinus]